MQFSDFWIGKIQTDKLPEAIDSAGLLKYLTLYTSDEQCFHIIYQWHETSLKRIHEWWFPRQELLKVIQGKINKKGLSGTLRLCLELLDTSEKKSVTVAADRINIQIDILIHGGPELLISRRDPLGLIIIDFISRIKSVKQKEHWTTFLEHCLSTGDSNTPAPTWWKKAKELTARINHTHFISKLQDWISFAQALLIAGHKEQEGFTDYHIDFLSAINHNLLKTLIWCIPLANHPPLYSLLDNYIPWAYKRKGATGPLSAKTGTACLYTFTSLPFQEAFNRIVSHRKIVRHAGILKTINNILHDLADKHHISFNELEELIVPDFGLDEKGVWRCQLGDYTAIYTVGLPGVAVLSWEKEGIVQQKAPSAKHSIILKEFKQQIGEIDKHLHIQKDKLERAYLRLHPWSYTHWETCYLRHPLLNVLTTKLIWVFSTSAGNTTGCFLNGQIVDYHDNPITISSNTQVTLWHPINTRTTIINAWRNFLHRHQIPAPFEQVNREVYTFHKKELTDEFHSDRFSSLTLNREKFLSILSQRGWLSIQNLKRPWSFLPHLEIKESEIRVNFFVEKKEDGTILTDVINFYKEGQPLLLTDVPPLIYSEIIKDIRLFVTTAGTTEMHNK